jgi:hypothetical protein
MVTTTGFDERVMTLGEAAGWLERRFGRRPNAASIWRWATKGVKGVHLATISLGRYRYTTVSALERFIAETSLAKCSGARPADTSSSKTPDRNAVHFTSVEISAAGRRREQEKLAAKEYLFTKLGGLRSVAPRVQ